MSSGLHLDTHVVAWLYAGRVHDLSETASALIERNELWISAAVLLELDELAQHGVLLVSADEILYDLERRIGLKIVDQNFSALARAGLRLSWADDPIDRLICASALLAGAPLLTKDAHLHTHFDQAVW